jgi:hypothetical protein
MREGKQAEGELPDGGAENRRASSCRRPTEAQNRGRAGADGSTAGADVRRCRAAAGAAGRRTRAEEQPSRKQSSRFIRRLLSLPLPSPALAVNAARSRFPARGAYLGGRAVNFPRLLLFARARGRFPAERRPFGALPPRFGTQRRGAAAGVRLTPICAYTTPNAIRRTPYQCRSWRPRRPASLPRLVA